VKNNLSTNPRTAQLSTLQRELINALAYFGVFHHPLRADELQNVTKNYFSLDHIHHALDELVSLELCYRTGNYLSMHPDVEAEMISRHEKEAAAKKFFEKLPFYVRIIASFPFVRGVAVSGSLSKGLIHEDGDIDYFVITAHNRLWLARTLLVAFKKIALFNSRRYFCVNYFVSDKNLQIPDQNLFTATEVVTLLPVYNLAEFQRFNISNTWVKAYYGHYEHPIKMKPIREYTKPLKKFTEWLLNNKLGDALDVLSMHITVWRWHVKFKTFSRSKFDLALRSTRSVSKHHPRDFQTHVLGRMEDNRKKMYSRIEGDK
jgi:hypothetical protein